MLTFTKNFGTYKLYDLNLLGNPDKLLFLDIETTGLSAKNSGLYLVGIIYFKKNIENDSYNAILTQYFAESFSDELLILKEFASYISNFEKIITFNGDSFDLRYLENCLKQYDISNNIKELESIDLYRLLRPYKKLFNLEKMNQKALESFLGLSREDLYSGRELIDIYEKYCICPNDDILKLILGHNHDDMYGMIYILMLLSYREMFLNEFKFNDYNVVGNVLTLNFKSKISVPKCISFQKDMLCIELIDNNFNLSLTIIETEAKYFFNDYKNYYYLIYEDITIHKSLALFVDKTSKVKATKKTAFIKKFSKYIPIYGECELPIFKNNYDDKISLVEQDSFIEYLKNNNANAFLQSLLKQLRFI